MSTRCYILNLPNKILDLVYEYLPDMRDKLNFAKAHGVLGNAFAFHAGDIFKAINIGDRPIQEWSDILSLCGSSVTGIRTYDVNTTVVVVKLASMYCPKLEEFFFPVRSSFWEVMKPLLLTLQNLDRIEILNSFENVNVVETLQQLPKLENLKLHNFNRQDLENVGKLVNLKALTIDDTSDIQNRSNFCFQLFGIGNMESKFASIRMPKNHAEEQLWPNIELLDISYMDFNTSLPYLPTLKYLTIDNTRMSLTDLFGQSVFSYGKTLESLGVCPIVFKTITTDELGIIMKLKALKRLDVQLLDDDYIHYVSLLENLEELILQNSNITNRGVMMVINRCKKLRYLDLSRCSNVDSSMFMEAVAALSLRPKVDNPFLLVVSPELGDVDKSKLGGLLDVQYNWIGQRWTECPFVDDLEVIEI